MHQLTAGVDANAVGGPFDGDVIGLGADVIGGPGGKRFGDEIAVGSLAGGPSPVREEYEDAGVITPGLGTCKVINMEEISILTFLAFTIGKFETSKLSERNQDFEVKF